MAIQIILPELSSTHKHFLNEKPKHQKKKKKKFPSDQTPEQF